VFSIAKAYDEFEFNGLEKIASLQTTLSSQKQQIQGQVLQQQQQLPALNNMTLHPPPQRRRIET